MRCVHRIQSLAILSADGLPVVISEEFDEMAFPYCKTEQESARAAITRLGVPL
jgi:hypothetical protein